jgi:hypothetical protein
MNTGYVFFSEVLVNIFLSNVFFNTHFLFIHLLILRGFFASRVLFQIKQQQRRENIRICSSKPTPTKNACA